MKRFAMAMMALAFYPTASQAGVTSFTVTSATLSKSTGAISVTGTIVCTEGDMFLIETNIIQVSGRRNGVTTGPPHREHLFRRCRYMGGATDFAVWLHQKW
jgi:hypothetical protein